MLEIKVFKTSCSKLFTGAVQNTLEPCYNTGFGVHGEIGNKGIVL